MFVCKESSIARLALLIFSLVGFSFSASTAEPLTKTLANSRVPDTTAFVHTSAEALESTVASSTVATSTKGNAETTVKVVSSTKNSIARSTAGVVQSNTTSANQEKMSFTRSPGRLKSTKSPVLSGRSKVQEVAGIDCELPVLPRESRLWRGNETHELNLPVTMREECTTGGTSTSSPDEECPPVVVSWEGSADIQTGDILIVRIADSLLNDAHQDANNKITESNVTRDDGVRVHHTAPQPAVYQVTRQGHEHCDVSDGMLLDMTPLDDAHAKIITLYDKDLTEGVNLLIVVSEGWGSQCVRLRVTLKSDNCGDAQECSGKGVCYTNVSMDGYECQCCAGYAGPHCEERDACDPSPCLNNGICVDLTQPSAAAADATYHCLCPYGFTGRNCEKEPCSSAPCVNGGSCMSMAVNGTTSFHCACAEGWSGATCDRLLPPAAAPAPPAAACAASPCLNGICVEQTDRRPDEPDYRCFCEPGFTGNNCELEYNECSSSPCLNGGSCTDRRGGFTCACARGHTGNMCQFKVDLCSPSPCLSPRSCVQRGDSYSCECARGFAGDDCELPARTVCESSPCLHGGTCWPRGDSFYCLCRAGYTGHLCEEDFILESVVSEDVVGRGGAGGGAGGGVREVHLPLGLYHDRLHNVYIAAGTLGAAIAIVGLVVTACHCRVNKTYSRLGARVSRAAAAAARRLAPSPAAPLPRHAAHPAHPAHPAPFDHDMYYTLDFSDSQTSPLIK